MPTDLWICFAGQREEDIACMSIMEAIRVRHCGKVQVVSYHWELIAQLPKSSVDTFHDADPDLHRPRQIRNLFPPRFITGTREHNFKQALHSYSEAAGANTILLQENSSLQRISPSYCDMLTTRRQGEFWTAGRSFCTISDWVGSPRHRDPANFCPLSKWMLSCRGRSSNTENLTARLPFVSWHKAMALSPPPK